MKAVFYRLDTELATLVCKKFVSNSLVEIIWDTKEVELNASPLTVLERFDDHPERQEIMEITKPYIKNARWFDEGRRCI